MQNIYRQPVWKTSPFIRLLIPLIIGILLQWYLQFSLPVIVAAIVCFAAASFVFLLLPLALRFTLKAIQGIMFHLLLLCIGLLLVWQKDIRHNPHWFGKYYTDSNCLILRIGEPVIEKAKSYKANCDVDAVIQNNKAIAAKGEVLVYFSKDSTAQQLQYGDRILINKNLQAIKNSGNPGAFNYEQYAAFQQTFHNVFLKPANWLLLKDARANVFQQFIYQAREKVLSALQKNINSGKDELGIAEALLIGYTNDLDKALVQAYSNTGVVHVIAISGMHLGLIYVLLVWLFARMPIINKSKVAQVILILSCLWLFSLLTGAAASVIRSAVMFTFITYGKNFSRRSSIYNSLAASAFVMLCYNPYYLWDVGFQLSYLAVVGIIIFQKPVYNCIYIKNKWIDAIWKLMAISLAAQILTFPICIYYFHQFPNLFLITNLIIVPLSSVILYVEIALVALSWISLAGTWLGKLTTLLVWIMNKIVVMISEISFAIWDNIFATITSTVILYILVIAFSYWLMQKNKKAFVVTIAALLLFTGLHTFYKFQSYRQQKFIVYNVPQLQAIDMINGNSYRFIGDSVLQQNSLLQNFHLKPSRVSLQLNEENNALQSLFQQNIFYWFCKKRIVIINKPVQFEAVQQRINVDMIVISKNPAVYINKLATVFNCSQYIFDVSNAPWRIEKWKKDCDDLGLKYYSVPENGAFITDLSN